MLTGAALVESGFDPNSPNAGEPRRIKPNTSAVRRSTPRCWTRRGSIRKRCMVRRPAQIARGKIQTLAVADEFPSVMQDLIAAGVKTHFIYHVVAKNNAYKRPLPDVLEDRPGQMDAFGIASGLVAIHTRRPDNSFMEFVQRDNPKQPVLHRVLQSERPADGHAGHDGAGRPTRRSPATASQEPSGMGAARARADRHQERQLGRPSAITPTGTATRAPRRARSRRARRRPATRAW